MVALGLGACVPPVVVVPPLITGTPRVGVTLTASSGVWLLAGTPTYQWQRCEADASGCTDVPAATADTYTPTEGDLAKRLRIRVTNTNQYGAKDA